MDGQQRLRVGCLQLDCGSIMYAVRPGDAGGCQLRQRLLRLCTWQRRCRLAFRTATGVYTRMGEGGVDEKSHSHRHLSGLPRRIAAAALWRFGDAAGRAAVRCVLLPLYHSSVVHRHGRRAGIRVLRHHSRMHHLLCTAAYSNVAGIHGIGSMWGSH